MDVEEYRRRYTAEVEAAQQAAGEDESGQRGFAAGMARFAAAEPVPEDADVIAAITGAAGADAGAASADTGARVAAIDAARFDATAKPAVAAALLAVLRNAADDPVVRRAALGALQENSFRVAAFRPYANDYLGALRTIATDPDPTLRERAMEILALEKDGYVQRLLIDGLRDPAKALIAPERALQLIGFDVHAEYYDLLRDLVSGSDDESLRNAALRMLAADSESKDLFVGIVRNKAENAEARALSGMALNSLAPEEFTAVAQDIVLDRADDDDLRATLLTALSHGPGEQVRSDLAERILAEPVVPSPELTRAAERFASEQEASDG